MFLNSTSRYSASPNLCLPNSASRNSASPNSASANSASENSASANSASPNLCSQKILLFFHYMFLEKGFSVSAVTPQI